MQSSAVPQQCAAQRPGRNRTDEHAICSLGDERARALQHPDHSSRMSLAASHGWCSIPASGGDARHNAGEQSRVQPPRHAMVPRDAAATS